MTDTVLKSLPMIPTSVTLEFEQYRWLQQRAEVEKRSMSLIVRDLIEAARKQEAA